MKKTVYVEANRNGTFVRATGYDVTNRLPAELRAMGPWYACGDARRGWYLTHGPSGMRAGWNASALRGAIDALAAREVDNVRRATSAAPVIPADERVRALSAVDAEAAQ